MGNEVASKFSLVKVISFILTHGIVAGSVGFVVNNQVAKSSYIAGYETGVADTKKDHYFIHDTNAGMFIIDEKKHRMLTVNELKQGSPEDHTNQSVPVFPQVPVAKRVLSARYGSSSNP